MFCTGGSLCACPGCTGTGFINGHGFLPTQPAMAQAYTYAYPSYGQTSYTTLIDDGGCGGPCCGPAPDIEININGAQGYGGLGYSPLSYASVVASPMVVGGGYGGYAAPMVIGGYGDACGSAICNGNHLPDMTARGCFDQSFARIERERRNNCRYYDSYGTGGCMMM